MISPRHDILAPLTARAHIDPWDARGGTAIGRSLARRVAFAWTHTQPGRAGRTSPREAPELASQWHCSQTAATRVLFFLPRNIILQLVQPAEFGYHAVR